jgi:hypothetical protein
MKADCAVKARPELQDIPLVSEHCVPSAQALQRVYERSFARQRASYGLAKSTNNAADYLIQQGDPKRLEAWLMQHGKQERAAIVAYIDAKRTKHESPAGNGRSARAPSETAEEARAGGFFG